MKNKILFCICTKNRKLKLSKNLLSIRNLRDYPKYNIEVILVSNDKANYSDLLNRFKNNIKINFFRESFPGVVFPRNKILKILRKKKFDYAAFIDDDCVIDKNWLISMMNVIKKKKVDIVAGPQLSKSNNIFLKIMERNCKNGSRIKWASTNNVFFHSNIIRNNINFSIQLNKIGGEDQLFFSELFKTGKSFLWNSYAPVYEFRDARRENFRWFFKRNIRYGTSSTIIYRILYGNFNGSFVVLIKLISDLIKFFINLSKAIISRKYFFSSLMYLIRIMGIFLGIFGYQEKEY